MYLCGSRPASLLGVWVGLFVVSLPLPTRVSVVVSVSSFGGSSSLGSLLESLILAQDERWRRA